MIKKKDNNILHSPNKVRKSTFLIVMLSILFIMETILSLQGFCMADEGFSLTGYQQIFNEPKSVQYLFLFYNSLWIGGIWEAIFGWMGIFGFRLLNILFMLGSWTIIYFLLCKYINRYTIFLGALFVAIAHDYGVMVFDHSSVTVLISVATAFFLFKALSKDSCKHIFVAGILLAINIFSRIPNIASLLLLLTLIPYYIYLRNVSQTFKLLGSAILGLITGIIIECGFMYSFGHLSIFINNLTTGMSAATSSDSSHNINTMLQGYFHSYIQIAKDILKIAALPLLAIYANKYLKKKFMRIALAVALFMCQGALLIYTFDNMLFLYAFISIILFYSLYVLRKSKDYIYLILIALITLYIMPYGSDFGINNMGENAIWVATPLSIGLAADGLKRLVINKRHLGTIAFAVFIFSFIIKDVLHIMNYAYFDEGPRYDKYYKINNPLATTFTNKSYAEETNDVLTELHKYVKEGDYLFCFQSRPMLHYLTHTRPYMYNPWPWSFDTSAMRYYLQKAEARGEALPILVREKGQIANFTSYDPDWDNIKAKDDFGHKNAKIKLIQDFIKRHNYKVIWESETFQVLKSF